MVGVIAGVYEAGRVLEVCRRMLQVDDRMPRYDCLMKERSEVNG